MNICHVFTHVPKCGGTSLLRQLRATPVRLVEDYESYDGVDFSQAPAGGAGPAAIRSAQEADLIWGHFPVTRYQGPELRYVTLIRDPLERMISNYHADRAFAVADPQAQGARALLGAQIAEGRLSILDYLRHSSQSRDIYRRFLCRWGAHHFALVGRTDRYEDFAAALGARLGVRLPVETRQPKPYAQMDLSPRERDAARRYLQEEYFWFDRMSEAAV